MSEAAATSSAPEIPDKLFFRIGEVSTMLGLEPYVLRYWETEFPSLSPKKSGTGHRLYRRKDVELLLRIKHLLYEKRFTIDGARQFLIESPPKRDKTRTASFVFGSDARDPPGIVGDFEIAEVGSYFAGPTITE